MDQSFSRLYRIILGGTILLCTATGLAGCGRKGPLQLPANAPPVPSQADADTQTRVFQNNDNPGLIQPPNKTVQQPVAAKLDEAARNPRPAINGAPAPTKKPFVLDPLL